MIEIKDKNIEIKDGDIRQFFDEVGKKWYFSIVDVVAKVVDTSDARNYWKVLKNRLKKSQNKLVTACNQLKMRASDGKFYLTDAGTKRTILSIVENISPEKLEKIEKYLNQIEASSPSEEIGISTVLDENNENILPLDSYEKDGFLIIKTFVAGVEIENISINIGYEKLEIKGRRIEDRNLRDKDYLKEELMWGNFSRELKLPFLVDINEASAELERGLLTIKIKKLDRERKKEIRIKSI